MLDASPAESRLIRVLLLSCGALLALVLALHPVVNFDLGFHLRTGEIVLAQGIPTTDPFSFTIEGAPWFLEQWLGTTIFYAVWKTLGIEGLVVFKAAVVALAFFLVTLSGRRTGAGVVAAVVAALLAVAAGEVRFRAQPYVFSFVGLALTCWHLERFRIQRDLRSVWPIVPLFALWPHVHVGYLYGLAAVGSFTAGAVLERLAAPRLPHGVIDARLDDRAVKVLIGLTAACGAAALLSLITFHPVGFGTLARVWEIFVSDFYRQNYQEMRSLAVAYGVNLPVMILWSLPMIVWLALRRRIALPHVLMWAAFVFTGIRVGRMVAESSIVVAPIAAAALQVAAERLAARDALGALRRLLPPRRLAAGVVIFTLLASANYVRLGWARGLGWSDWNYPRACYEWIDENGLPPRMFNDMFFGGTFIFHFYPRRKVFIDGRTPYREEFFRGVYEPIKSAAPGWEEIIDKARIDWFLLADMRFKRLHGALHRSPRWEMAHRQGTCVIYTRVDTQPDVNAEESSP